MENSSQASLGESKSVAWRLLPTAQAVLEAARRYTPANGKMGPVAVLRAMADLHPELPGEAVCAAVRRHMPAPVGDESPRNGNGYLVGALRELGGIPMGVRSLAVALLRNEGARYWLSAAVPEKALVAWQERLLGEYAPEDDIVDYLRGVISGQDDALRSAAEAIVQGFSAFRAEDKPRGVMFLAGPTGVGKTELATAISHMMGGALVRFDCNAMAGGGDDEKGRDALLWTLFGPVSGFKASEEPAPFDPVLEKPDSVILFDEFEKAPKFLSKILLQMLDKGEVIDTKHRRLNLRGCCFIMTSNAGVTYAESRRSCGFGAPAGEAIPAPAESEAGRVTPESLKKGLSEAGVPPEVLGRIRQWVIFSPMTHATLIAALNLQAGRMIREFRAMHREIEIAPGVLEAYAETHGVGLGVRRVWDSFRGDLTGRLTRLSLLVKAPSPAAPHRLVVRWENREGRSPAIQVECRAGDR